MPPKKKTKEKPNALLDAINAIQSKQGKTISSDDSIVDIMTFCFGSKYLNLPEHNFKLFQSQKTILKTFYMGSIGNENLKLDENDWKWLQDNAEDEERDGITFKKNCDQVIEKIRRKERDLGKTIPNFKKLHLVLGRRGTKTILASVITAYEVYKLVTINNGDPHGYYGLPHGAEIVIINVALSQKQAGLLFGAICDRIDGAEILKGRIAYGNTQEIGVYTDRELQKISDGGSILSVKPSIKIMCGHSNPKTLRGNNAILLLFDELAFYDDTGKVTGSQFYNDLEPSVSHFVPYGHDKIVCISSPNLASGIFYDIFKSAEETDEILAYQLPTWCVNETVTYDSLAVKRKRNPDAFAIEHGAQWAKSGLYGYYFPEDLIMRCVEAGVLKGIREMERPDPQFHYYLHVDPAKNGDRYVAVMVAREQYRNVNMEKRIRIRLAKIWVWDPTPGIGLLFNEIDKEVLQICQQFRPRLVTYDQFQSAHSLQFLKRYGIPNRETSYNRSYKMTIYQNLREMMSYHPHPELWLYDDHRLILEMKCLRYRPTKRGYTLVKEKGGEVETDDIIDCLAGATSAATNVANIPLPRPVTVNMGRL